MNQEELDQESEYFRICPECKLEFIAYHLTTKFCHPKCRDLYHNRIKRKNAEGLIKGTQNTDELRRLTLEKTITILDAKVIAEKGTEYPIVNLLREGMDFNCCEARFPLGQSSKYYYLQFGQYFLYWTDTEKVLIIKKS